MSFPNRLPNVSVCMTSIAAVSAVMGEGESARTLLALAANSAIGEVAVAARPHVKVASDAFHRRGSTSPDSAAAVLEVLRWFERTEASHLLRILSPRIELTATGLAHL